MLVFASLFGVFINAAMRKCDDAVMFYRGLQDVKEQNSTKFGNMGEVAKNGLELKHITCFVTLD